MASNPMSKRFAPSAEELPPSDPRDAAIKSLNAKCRELIELAHQLQDAERKLFTAKNADPVDVDALTECAVAFGGLEEKFYNLKDKIEDEYRDCNQNKKLHIFLSHTESGMPIRVREACKKSIWD